MSNWHGSTAFGGIANILNGKSWTNALCAYQMLVAVLLQYLLKDGLQADAAIVELCFLCAEIERQFLLRQHCLKWMARYFFATENLNLKSFLQLMST